MSSLRMIVLMLLLAGTLAACGGAGSGGANSPGPRFTPIPGTPAGSPEPTYGY